MHYCKQGISPHNTLAYFAPKNVLSDKFSLNSKDHLRSVFATRETVQIYLQNTNSYTVQLIFMQAMEHA